MSNYSPPVNRLLTLGKLDEQWLDYPGMGLGPQHIADLVRMVQDRNLLDADSEPTEVYAPNHACRALGQLRAEAAAEPMLAILAYEDEQDRDWCFGEFPGIFEEIGPGILGSLTAFLRDPRNSLTRGLIADAIGRIAVKYPEHRLQVVELFCRILEGWENADPVLNGFIIAALLDMNAVESLPTIERAFAERRVDPTIAGTWQHVKWELGGKEGPEPRLSPRQLHESFARGEVAGRSSVTPRERAEARRKKAKKTREKKRKQ